MKNNPHDEASKVIIKAFKEELDLIDNNNNMETKKCPNCETKGGLFRCSMGALNCSNCMQYIDENSKDEVNQVAINLAIKFHNYYEELAPDFGYETKKETKKFDPKTPNGKLMIAVCERILANLVL